MDEKKKAPEEEKKPDREPEKKPGEAETKPEQEQPQETKSGPEKADADDKQAGENGEGAPAEPEQEEQPQEEAPAEEPAPEPAPEAASDSAAELETLRAENARLKAQLEAHGTGFKPEYIEDAVLIAENAVSRDGITITEALQAVAKKYPEWKHTADEKGKSGFKVGAETPKEDKSAEDNSLDEAFGIRRKK